MNKLRRFHRSSLLFLPILLACPKQETAAPAEPTTAPAPEAPAQPVVAPEPERSNAQASDAEVSAAARAISAFGLNLYAELRKTPAFEGKSIFFSPYSVTAALAMTAAGAKGETASQMRSVLQLSMPAGKEHTALGALEAQLDALGQAGELRLDLANALWVQEGAPLLDPYVSLVKGSYGAGLEQLNFAAQPEPSRLTINTWVADRTEQRVLDLLPKGSISPATRLVLTNAIYFKGLWRDKFDKKLSTQLPFRVGPGKEPPVWTMRQTEKLGYAETEAVQVLELPYKGERISMVVLLPRERGGLAKLEKGLSQEQLDGWLGKLAEQKVDVFLPRFTFKWKTRLEGPLNKLGMVLPMGPQADFSGFNGKKPGDRDAFFIGAVYHSAFVAVDEEGTEAAAATAVVMRGQLAPTPPPVFKADHPFLFLIRDGKTGAVLFMGRVLDPSA